MTVRDARTIICDGYLDHRIHNFSRELYCATGLGELYRVIEQVEDDSQNHIAVYLNLGQSLGKAGAQIDFSHFRLGTDKFDGIT